MCTWYWAAVTVCVCVCFDASLFFLFFWLPLNNICVSKGISDLPFFPYIAYIMCEIKKCWISNYSLSAVGCSKRQEQWRSMIDTKEKKKRFSGLLTGDKYHVWIKTSLQTNRVTQEDAHTHRWTSADAFAKRAEIDRSSRLFTEELQHVS